jgi:hypothetical protein
MHDTIVAGKIRYRDHPNIFSQFSVDRNDLLPCTVIEQAQIASGDGVASLLEEINEMSPDIATMTGDENFHALLLANPAI